MHDANRAQITTRTYHNILRHTPVLCPKSWDMARRLLAHHFLPSRHRKHQKKFKPKNPHQKKVCRHHLFALEAPKPFCPCGTIQNPHKSRRIRHSFLAGVVSRPLRHAVGGEIGLCTSARCRLGTWPRSRGQSQRRDVLLLVGDFGGITMGLFSSGLFHLSCVPVYS